MSQHIINTTDQRGKRVSVQMGWDRPLQQHFLVVEELDATDDGEGNYLYSNLADPMAGGCRDFSYFEDKLSELGIEVPEEMVFEVVADQFNNVGNRYVNHTPSNAA